MWLQIKRQQQEQLRLIKGLLLLLLLLLHRQGRTGVRSCRALLSAALMIFVCGTV
jgi:hypothetical protein